MSPEDNKLKGGKGIGKTKTTLPTAIALAIKNKMEQEALKLHFEQKEKTLSESPGFL